VAEAWRRGLEPALQRVRARRARTAFKRWWAALLDGLPPHSVTYSDDGASPASWPGKAMGFFRRQALIRLQSGLPVACDLQAPLAGPYRFSMLLATYRTAPEGTLQVDVEDGTGRLASDTHDLAKLHDGAIIGIRCDVRQAGPLRIVVTYRGAGPVALYAFSDRARTVFTTSGLTVPFGFVN
jgi:hypothetical protein